MATTINRLRVGGAPAANPAYRLALERTLGQVELQPRAMPPAAILIVRRLADPLPGRLRPAIAGQPDVHWQRAARQAMERLYSRAARPATGPAPAGAEAVCFADEAELLACLALDASLNRAANRWWWQAYRRRWGSLARSIVPALLLESPRTTPAALRLLAATGQAGQVMQCLSPGQARQVMEAVCAAFDMAPPDLSLVQAQPQSESASGQQRPELAGWAPSGQSWLADAGHLGEGLAPEHQCLLGVALALAHAPAYARSTEFRQAVQRWWQTAHARRGPAQSADPAQRGSAAVAPDAVQLSPQPTRASRRPAVPGNAASVPPDAAALLHETSAAPSVPASIGRPSGDDAQDSGARPPGLPDDAGQAGSASPDSHPVPLQAGAASVRPIGTTLDPWHSLEGVATGLGGVLFLLNVMQRLDLPACFQAEWRLASQVGPWGTLELLGRALLLEASGLPAYPEVGNLADLAADPLWAVLAALAGRHPGEVAGANLTGPDHLQIPDAWARWLGADGRAGQRIDLAGVAPLEGPLLAGVSRDLRRWLAVVIPLLHQMLAGALGSADDIAAGLLLRRSQLYVTLSHLDLVLPLESASIPVRMAGLDFDPGWLPALGRVVQFHYE